MKARKLMMTNVKKKEMYLLAGGWIDRRETE